MEIKEVVQKLKNFRKKWRRASTKENKFQEHLRQKYKGDYVPGCYEKSVGIDIGYGHCTGDIDNLIRMLECPSKK